MAKNNKKKEQEAEVPKRLGHCKTLPELKYLLGATRQAYC
jgi:hypothetical protein